MNAGFGVSLGFADLRREGVWSVMWSVRARARTQSLSWVLSVFDRRAHDCGATIAGWAVSPVSPNVERQLSGSDAGVACSGRSSIGGWAKGRPHPTSPPTSPARRLIEGAGSGNRRDSRSRLSSRSGSSRSGSSSPRATPPRRRSTEHRSGRSPRVSSIRRSRTSSRSPRPPSAVYQQILPSLVKIETRTSIIEGQRHGTRRRGDRQRARRDPHRVPRRRRRDEHPRLVRRRHRDRRPIDRLDRSGERHRGSSGAARRRR